MVSRRLSKNYRKSRNLSKNYKKVGKSRKVSKNIRRKQRNRRKSYKGGSEVHRVVKSEAARDQLKAFIDMGVTETNLLNVGYTRSEIADANLPWPKKSNN